MSAITIDMPGMIVRPDTPRFEGVLADAACPPPAQGDKLCIGGVMMNVLDVTAAPRCML